METSLEIRPYDENDQVGTFGGLKAAFGLAKATIEDVLPSHMDAQKMLREVMAACDKNPKILECTRGSVLASMISAAEYGLRVSGVGGEGYLVPFWNGSKKQRECQFQIGYKGLVKLARQTGEVRRIEAGVVYENDTFEFVRGLNPVLHHVPLLIGVRGKVIGAWALVELTNGGAQPEFMREDEIEQVRQSSQQKDSGPWRDWRDEQRKKTVWKRLSKWCGLSSERYHSAVEYDNKEYSLSQTRTTHSQSDDLNASLGLDKEPTQDAHATLRKKYGYSDEQLLEIATVAFGVEKLSDITVDQLGRFEPLVASWKK